MLDYKTAAMERVKRVKADLNTLTFPEMIEAFRKALGITKHLLASDTGFHYQKMYHLERGDFSKPLSDLEVRMIASYFDVNEKMVKEKMYLHLAKEKINSDKKYSQLMSTESGSSKSELRRIML